MTAIVRTNTTLFDTNLADNKDTHIYVQRSVNASENEHSYISTWKGPELEWVKYQIKESDMRIKTATFTSPNYIDLTTGRYYVLITSKLHDDFGGVILKVSHDKDTGLYEYQCQDFSRLYQSKFDLICKNVKTHRLLKTLITQGGYPLKGKIKSWVKTNWKKTLSGLRPAYHYDQEFYGSTFKFNPMVNTVTAIIRDKSYIEAIRDLVFGSGAYIDVYFDKYGILHIEPYHKNDLYNSGLILTSPEIAAASYNFDTTNILTRVQVQSTDNTKTGKTYSSASLLNLDLTVFFGDLRGSISNPNEKTTTASTTTTNKTSKKKTTKKAVTSKKTDNPYGTKKKEVWICMDRSSSVSNDNKYLRNICKQFKKNGWKCHNIGRNTEAHYKYRDKAKKGVWFMLFNGLDPGVLRYANDPWFRTPLVKHKARMVFGFHADCCDMRKGGNCYKHVGKAWDDHYSGRNTALKYPAKYLTKHAVPFCYAKGYDAKAMVAKFLAGGDNPEACKKNWKFKGTGYYKD